jgi:two-component system, OmpR family, response regulator
MRKIIVVEDDTQLLETTVDYLSLRGFQVTGTSTEEEMKEALQREPGPTVVILDVMLEGENGIEIAERLRSQNETIGIIMLTALHETQDYLEGLKAGADIYLTKPMDLKVLEAKVEALFRRVNQSTQTTNPEESRWYFNTISWELNSPDGQTTVLTGLERNFLQALASSPGETATFSTIAKYMGSSSKTIDEHRIAVLVNRFRKKVKQKTGHKLPISSSRGTGYSFTAKISLQS